MGHMFHLCGPVELSSARATSSTHYKNICLLLTRPTPVRIDRTSTPHTLSKVGGKQYCPVSTAVKATCKHVVSWETIKKKYVDTILWILASNPVWICMNTFTPLWYTPAIFFLAAAAINESCFFNEQCEAIFFQTECRDGRCICRFEMSPIWGKDGSVECKGRCRCRSSCPTWPWSINLLFAGFKQCNGKSVYLQGARTSEDPRPTLIRPWLACW